MASKKLLLVDTNIISHALTPNQTAAYVQLFEKLEKEYTFLVTGFTKYEIMCTSDKAHKKKIAEFLDQNMAYVTLSKALMDFAAKLCYLYKEHPSTKHKIEMGDIVNAAFAIAKPCHILTINNVDYPLPFFTELEAQRDYVKYKSKNSNDITDVVHVLKPDVEHTKECFSQYKV